MNVVKLIAVLFLVNSLAFVMAAQVVADSDETTEDQKVTKKLEKAEKEADKEKSTIVPKTSDAPKISLSDANIVSKTIDKPFPKIETPKNSFIEKAPITQADDEYHKGEFYVGYSGALVVDDEFGFEGGVNVSGVYYFHRYVGAKGDFSATFQDISSGTHSLYNVTGGIQFKDSLKSKKIKPFAHALVGVSRHKDKFDFAPRADFGETGLSTIFGGGLDIKVSDNIDIRAFQLDINPIFFSRDITGFRRTYLNFRYGAGVVFNF